MPDYSAISLLPPDNMIAAVVGPRATQLYYMLMVFLLPELEATDIKLERVWVGELNEDDESEPRMTAYFKLLICGQPALFKLDFDVVPFTVNEVTKDDVPDKNVQLCPSCVANAFEMLIEGVPPGTHTDWWLPIMGWAVGEEHDLNHVILAVLNVYTSNTHYFRIKAKDDGRGNHNEEDIALQA